jgi:hypothetical protein
VLPLVLSVGERLKNISPNGAILPKTSFLGIMKIGGKFRTVPPSPFPFPPSGTQKARRMPSPGERGRIPSEKRALRKFYFFRQTARAANQTGTVISATANQTPEAVRPNSFLSVNTPKNTIKSAIAKKE